MAFGRTVPHTFSCLRRRQLEHTEGACGRLFADVPLGKGDAPALSLQGLQEPQSPAAEGVGEEDPSLRHEVRLEDPAEVGMQRLAVEDVRADDPIVAPGSSHSVQSASRYLIAAGSFRSPFRLQRCSASSSRSLCTTRPPSVAAMIPGSPIPAPSSRTLRPRKASARAAISWARAMADGQRETP